MFFVDPKQSRRRSQLYRWHASRNAVFIERSDAVFVDHYDGSRDEMAAAGRLGICDLSLLRRHGITGTGSTTWLRAHGYEPPSRPNSSTLQHNGDLLARLSAQEYLILRLSDFDPGSASSQSEWGDADGRAYAAPRADSHCLFAVTGDRAATAFSKICGVDLRPHMFEDGCVAQTSVARVNAIAIRHDLHRTNNFFLLTATSAAEYLWESLLDAIGELDGMPVGIAALRAISKTRS